MVRVNKKMISIMLVVIVVIILVAAGLVLRHHKSNKKLSSAKQTVGNHTIALGQSNAPANSSGLSVSGQADSLGQLNGSNNSSGSGQASSSSNGSSNDVDPATFSQYDKYASNPNALIGEIQQGTGAELTAGHKANIYYKVWLTNGALMDQSPVSSSGQRQPFSFTLGGGQVIPGLEEGVVGMKAGGKRLVIVPPGVGYGAQGQGSIPPNAVLVFEVQLASVQ
jgi:hypothetical protein